MSGHFSIIVTPISTLLLLHNKKHYHGVVTLSFLFFVMLIMLLFSASLIYLMHVLHFGYFHFDTLTFTHSYKTEQEKPSDFSLGYLFWMVLLKTLIDQFPSSVMTKKCISEVVFAFIWFIETKTNQTISETCFGCQRCVYV